MLLLRSVLLSCRRSAAADAAAAAVAVAGAAAVSPVSAALTLLHQLSLRVSPPNACPI